MANEKKKITTRQKKAIAALISCKNNQEAAKAVGVGYRTITRWLTDDLFLAELRKAEAAIISGAVRSMIDDLPRNSEVMREIREKQRTPEYVKLRAAQLIDQSLRKWREIQDIEERLTAIEQMVLDK